MSEEDDVNDREGTNKGDRELQGEDAPEVEELRDLVTRINPWSNYPIFIKLIPYISPILIGTFVLYINWFRPGTVPDWSRYILSNLVIFYGIYVLILLPTWLMLSVRRKLMWDDIHSISLKHGHLMETVIHVKLKPESRFIRIFDGFRPDIPYNLLERTIELATTVAERDLIPSEMEVTFFFNRAHRTFIELKEQKNINELRKHLRDPAPIHRESAIEALADILLGDATELIIPLLDDEDRLVRYTAVEALERVGDARAIPPLMGLFSHDDEALRMDAVRAVAAIISANDASKAVIDVERGYGPEQTVAHLYTHYARALLGDEDARSAVIATLDEATERGDRGIQLQVLQMLVDIGDEDDTKRIIGLMASDDVSVRILAIMVAGKLGLRATEPTVVRMLNDDEVDVRAMAAEALGEIRDANSVSHLIRALEDPDHEVRIAVGKALGEIGDPTALPHLRRAFGRRNKRILRSILYTPLFMRYHNRNMVNSLFLPGYLALFIILILGVYIPMVMVCLLILGGVHGAQLYRQTIRNLPVPRPL